MRRDLSDRLSMAHSLDGIAATASRAGFAEAGARLYGAGARLREELGAPVPASERARYETGLEMTRSAIGDEAYERAWAAGRALSLEDAVPAFAGCDVSLRPRAQIAAPNARRGTALIARCQTIRSPRRASRARGSGAGEASANPRGDSDDGTRLPPLPGGDVRDR